MVFKILLNLIVKASDFFFNRLCPFCAPLSLAFMIVRALKMIIKTLYAMLGYFTYTGFWIYHATMRFDRTNAS